ncbi:MAG: carotenoid oxygenase family protein [Prochloraceae cyanobacterium]
MSTTKVNPYLEGNFAPVDGEIDAQNLEVIGEIPADLKGMFLRNGPNPQFEPIGEYHWFDGDGMIHAVKIEAGIASYRNRYVQTTGWKIENEANQAIWSGLLEPPQMDLPHGPTKNTANTALIAHAGELLALWEGGEPHAIELPTLATIGPKNYDGKLDFPFTAHPKIDPETQEKIFFGYSLVQPPFVKYGIVSAAGNIVKTEAIEIPVGVMMHDFAITQNYTIFMDLPYTFRIERAEKGQPILMFESDRPSRFGIMPRHGSNKDIIWFESPACYIFHTMNAYEDGDEVVLIACRSDSSEAISSLDKTPDPEANIPRLHRWRFNLKTKEVSEARLSDIPCEFPRINEAFIGRKNRYGYAGIFAPTQTALFEGIIKYDFQSDRVQVHKFAENCYGGEAVFAPKVDAVSEDDGYLLTFVCDEKEQTSELIIIDAKKFENAVLARVIIPQRVPYGFHALWV